jgi:sigma-E factor negative regulatory protein RseB
MTGAMRGRILLAAVCAFAALPAAASDNPHAWLDRMAYALEYLNYEGTLVQLHGADAAVMRVVHRVENGVPTERITALDEVGREIIREGDDVKCILPDQQAVMVGKRGEEQSVASPLRRQFAGDLRVHARHYRLTIASGGKLLGRETRIVTVRPEDAYRYGYRLWLDRVTAIPLKVQVAGDEGVVVEQLLFSDIKLPDRIPASAVRPSRTIDSFTWRRTSPADGEAPAAAVGSAAWQATALPPGFSLRAARYSRAGPAGEPLDQLVYSDGLATVSAFIEAGVAVAERAQGPSGVGASNAYTTVSGDYLVTAVGEVPVRTVETIARSVRPAASPDRPAR